MTAADVAGECAAGQEAGRAVVTDPMIFAVVTTETVLHGEGKTLIEGLGVDGEAPFEVVGVNTFGPSVAEFLLEGAAGKDEPAAVEIGAEFVDA